MCWERHCLARHWTRLHKGPCRNVLTSCFIGKLCFPWITGMDYPHRQWELTLPSFFLNWLSGSCLKNTNLRVNQGRRVQFLKVCLNISAALRPSSTPMSCCILIFLYIWNFYSHLYHAIILVYITVVSCWKSSRKWDEMWTCRKEYTFQAIAK